MGEKLKGSSKLKLAKRPVTTRDKEKEKPQKLGLLTEKRRKMVSFRMTNDFINLLEELVKTYRRELYHRISKTDILEASLLHISKMAVEDVIKVLNEYGVNSK